MKMNFGTWIGIIFGLAGAAIGIYASIDPMAVGNMFSQIGPENLAIWLPIGIVVLVAAIIIPMLLPLIKSAMKNSQNKKRLAMVGVKGSAKVLAVQDTGMTVNMNPYVKITVEVKPGIQASFSMMVSRLSIPRPGDSIDVLYDPSDLTCVMPALM